VRIGSLALLRAQRLATEERELNERIAEVDTRIATKRREIGIANNPAIKVTHRFCGCARCGWLWPLTAS